MNKQEIKQILIAYGYYPANIDDKMEKVSTLVDISHYTKKQIKIVCYEKPTQEIPKFYCDKALNKIFVIDGEINLTKTTLLKTEEFTFVDFNLSHNLFLIGITKYNEIAILLYLPNDDTIIRYTNNTYEEVYGKERKEYAEICKNSLFPNKIILEDKIKEIMCMLISDFVIDKMIIEKTSPKWKLYQNAEKFADIITNYEYKYIDKYKNCVEKIEKKILVKAVGNNVKIGNISNEPYLALKECNQLADFSLSSPSYVWFSYNSKSKEELAIYTANKKYTVETYQEMLNEKEDIPLKEEAEKLKKNFEREVGYSISNEYIFDCLKKLNRELIIFPSEFLKHEKEENLDSIKPIRYNYRVITDPKEFENVLYNSIVEEFKGKCRYKLVERLSGLYTLIGNKFSDDNQEQTIADFNINANAAVVKKETFLIEEIASRIRKNGMDNKTMNSLPIPILDVIFYFPRKKNVSNEIKMYNGSNIEDVFNYISDNDEAFEVKKFESNINYIKQDSVEKNKDMNIINNEIIQLDENVSKKNEEVKTSKKLVKIRYINELGKQIQNEEIREAEVGEKIIFTNEEKYIDSTGKHWILESNNEKYIIVSENDEENIIILRYLPLLEDVVITFQDEEGNELKSKKIVQAQLGSTFCYSENKSIKDKNGNVWNLIQKEDKSLSITEEENIINNIYEVAKAQVVIKYLKSNGDELMPEERVIKQVGSGVVPMPKPIIYDNDNKGWKLSKVHPAILKVENKENIITIVYDVAIGKVTWKYLDTNGNELKNEEVQFVQIGEKYSPLVKERTIYKSEEVWKLMEINPYEIVVSENKKENIIELIYSNAH